MASEPTCVVVRGGETYEGKQGLRYFSGVSAENAGPLRLSMPVNVSETEPCTAVVARTDPNEQESVVVLDEDAV